MDFKNPIETARAILERDILSEDNSADTDCVECNEEETIEEGKVPPQFLKKKKNGKDDDEDDESDVDEAKDEDEDEDDDEEDVEEGKLPPWLNKKGKKKSDDDDDVDEANDEDEDEDDDEDVDEAAVILDVGDNQDAEGKKATAPAKGKGRMKGAEPKGKGKKGKGGVPSITPSNSGDHVNPSGKVKEHINALFNGENLTEEFRDKATTIFEAALNERVSAIEEDLVNQYNEKLEEGIETVKTELTEKLDDYLGYVVEEWMKENAVAIENGLKNEIAENFITGLKSLFESCYIDVPDEKYDVLTDYATRVNDLEEELNTQMEKSINLRKELLESRCGEIFTEVVDGLVDTEVEKLRSLSEGLEFESVEQYEDKLKVIKENYFNASSTTAHVTNEPIINNDVKPQGVMGLYTEALSRTNKTH